MDDKSDNPNLSLASEQSAEELARAEALARISWPLKSLAANLLRVVRGAGRAYELQEQMMEVLAGFEDYREAVGYYPTDYEIAECISIRYANSRVSDERIWAEDQVVQDAGRGAGPGQGVGAARAGAGRQGAERRAERTEHRGGLDVPCGPAQLLRDAQPPVPGG